MELNHTFTVPAGAARTWEAFQDVASVADCFPGATVTEVSGDTFKGSCKVKLGPVALVYSGSGTFRDRDEAARRLVVEAKGKDKRGNGTAGATVTATLTEEGPGTTRVDVVTDLAVTGKPAQFGRGMIQDVSDRLLRQFVACLEAKVGPADAGTAEPEAAAVRTGSHGSAEREAAPAAARADASPSGSPGPSDPSGPPAAREDRGGGGDALDLGTTVLPALAKAYGKPVLVGLAVVVLLVLVAVAALR